MHVCTREPLANINDGCSIQIDRVEILTAVQGISAVLWTLQAYYKPISSIWPLFASMLLVGTCPSSSASASHHTAALRVPWPSSAHNSAVHATPESAMQGLPPSYCFAVAQVVFFWLRLDDPPAPATIL
jgi:hypothetical protein